MPRMTTASQLLGDSGEWETPNCEWQRRNLSSVINASQFAFLLA